MDIEVSATTTSAVFNVPEVTTTVNLPDWCSCPTVFNDYFQKDSECYDGEKKLYDCIQAEAYNNFGVEMEFYPTTYDTTYDEVFGEDDNRNIITKFDIMAYYELPNNSKLYSRFGIEGIDNFHMYVNKTHFTSASYGSGVSIPNVGDIIKKKDEELYYEIVDAKDKEEQYLQSTHTWDLVVKPYIDYHMNLSGSTSSDSISAFTNQDDYLEINDFIENNKDDYLFNDL
jgi:hypothetical protein